MSDDFSWDPDVDRFLLDCVQHQLENSSSIDFGLISRQFLEVLGSEADNVDEDALLRFEPEGLCKRWMEIHTEGLTQEYYYSTAVVAVEASKDRVVDAMQSFLLGLPATNPLKPPDNPQEDGHNEDPLEMAFLAFEEAPTPERHQTLLALEETVLDSPLLFSQLRLLEPCLHSPEGREQLVEAARQRREKWRAEEEE